MKARSIILIMLLSVTGIPVSAWADDLKWHGFIAQGVIQADGSNFVNDDGDVSLRLTELGLNASYRINSDFRVAGQAVYINGGNRFVEGLRLDYLFLDWTLYNTLDTQVHLHLGRNKSYHRLYAATRDVPHTRPTIVLPQSLYIDVFRDVSIGIDGALFRAHFSRDWGELDINWNYGEAPISSKQTKLFVSPTAIGDLDLTREHQGSFYYRFGNGQHQIGANFVNATFEYFPVPNDAFVAGTSQVKGRYFNYQYNGERWVITSELTRVQFVTTDFLAPGLRGNNTAEGGYLQAQYFFTPTLAGLARIDLYDSNRKDRGGSRLEARGIPSYFGYMDMATLGVSWDFAPNWRLQGEVHRVKGTGRMSPILVPDLEINVNEYWDVWALQVMYWF